ncbi:MAG TPA: cytochrome c oxidase subunit II, partial [Chitinophagaceae bacterium]|nr:cytochrome c oxidase subunit II [Chitinophagaceae bacterium]
CGESHFSMKGIIKVVTQQEFDLWMAKQKTNYAQVQQDQQDSKGNTPPANTTADSAAAKGKTAMLAPIKSTSN